MTKTLHTLRLPLILAIGTSLGACSSIMSGDKVNYKSDGVAKTVPLDIPPDLTQLSRDSKYVLPGGPVTASGMGNAQAAVNTAQMVAVNQVSDVRLERDGSERWLVVDRPAEAVWPIVDQFWKDNGFTYVVEQQQIGLLETDWAENRAKIPQDGIRSLIGKVFDGLYSSGERDKFRTRIERNAKGGVDIFITHRGMSEEYTDASKSQTIWRPRPSDPGLEAEFLSRLMVKLGVSADTATKQVTASSAAAPAKSILENRSEGQVLVLNDSFDVAWRRVGVALDRTGFTVEDRDRAKGLYYVRYVDIPKEEEKGFFSRLFSSSSQQGGPQKYRLAVTSTATQSEVRVQNESGQPDKSAIAQRIYKLLADDLQ